MQGGPEAYARANKTWVFPFPSLEESHKRHQVQQRTKNGEKYFETFETKNLLSLLIYIENDFKEFKHKINATYHSKSIPDPHSFKSPTGRTLARETFGAKQNLAMIAACDSEHNIRINSLEWNPFISFHEWV